MVSTADVKRALRALTLRTETTTRPYAAVIDEGDAARADLRRAAGFVSAVGLDRLERAVDAAARAGDDERTARGRDAVAAYRQFCDAARVSTPTPASAESATSECRSDVEPVGFGDEDAGTSHYGPGTTKPPTDEPSKR
jgi:hypothetical protein